MNLMKHFTFMTFLCLMPTLLIAKKEPSPERAENAKIVISNVAQMIGHVGNIIENPHNAENVEVSVSNMVTNIIKIVSNAVQKKTIDRADAYLIITELEELCKDLDPEIVSKITTKKSTLFL